MTHFLARLVERARGTALQIEPIIAPRFAPAPAVEMTTEVEAPPLVRRKAREETTHETDQPRIRSGGPATKEIGRELSEKMAEPAPQRLLVPLEQSNDEVEQLPNGTRESRSLRRDLLPHVQFDAPQPVVRRRNHERRSAFPPSSIRPAITTNPVTLPKEPARNEPPIVRVTIGRIEVHAGPAPAASPRKPVSASGPKLTLDAYLKSRKEGAR